MTETVSDAVAVRDNGPAAMISRYKDDFATVIPSHLKPETFVRLAQGAMRRDRNLARIAQANPGSLMVALLECARLGHEPATESYYLVPYGSEIQGIEGYRGVIERIYRAGAVSAVTVEVVCENDRFDYKVGAMKYPDHEVDWFGDRGKIVGAYSYALMADGNYSKVVVISQDDIDRSKAESKGSDRSTSPWQKHYKAMVLKTAAHRLEPWVPTSSSYITERLKAARAAGEQAAPPTVVHPLPQPLIEEQPIDGELVEP
jgi:recombination protein RecT